MKKERQSYQLLMPYYTNIWLLVVALIVKILLAIATYSKNQIAPNKK